MDYSRFQQYLRALRQPVTKLCRLVFLNPDGSTDYVVGSGARNRYGGCFVADGSISVNFQNGQRRKATVTLVNPDGVFDYRYGRLWFGREVALDEGILLPDGTEYYVRQGVFRITDPSSTLDPSGEDTVKLGLSDKWACLDGTLSGKLEGVHEVAAGTNVFSPITALLAADAGNGRPRDPVSPVYTTYYNGRTQALPGGSTVSMLSCPYTLSVDSTEADIILKLAGMVNATVGYDRQGRLRIEASQDYVADATKPLAWVFSNDADATLLGLAYDTDNAAVYNDYIVYGDQADDYSQPKGRARNLDPKSPTNIMIAGRKTCRESASGYSTDTQCRDLAAWRLKRAAVLQSAVKISCTQILHLNENDLIEIRRTDREGSPMERHVVQGFTRPLFSGTMTIDCVSVSDFPAATIT